MTKYSAFGADLKAGVQQVETAVVVLDAALVGTSGDATVTTTCTGMTGSPIATTVAVLNTDSADGVATKIRTELNLNANITALFTIGGSGPYVTLTKKIPAANIADLNIAVADDTSAGITDDATSDNTQAGVALDTIAYVQSMGGPGLALDTEDVTTHDQTTAFEEVVSTVLRSGELSLDIVYDPAETTHNATAGLLKWLDDKTRVYFDLTFMSTYNWIFNGYVTGFEPSEPHDGALTASVTIKLDGAPTLE
jgi:hypothetical protein